MAEINQFGKGIALNCGFDLGAQELLDNRSIVADRAELQSIPDIRRANGLLVWIQDEKQLVAWDAPNEDWVNVGADEFDSTEIDNRITSIENNLSSLEVDDTFYDDKEYALATAHGGLAAGTDVKGWKIKDILKKILFPFQMPKLTLALDTTKTQAALGLLGGYQEFRFKGSLTEGDITVDETTYALYENTTNKLSTGNSDITIDSINEDSFDIRKYPSVSYYATVKTAANAEGDAAAYVNQTIKSNTITYTNVRPTFWGTATTSNVASTNESLSSYSQYIQRYEGNMDGWICQNAGLYKTQLGSSFTINIPAFSEKKIVILTPFKLSKIQNPSLFDITSSFTETNFQQSSVVINDGSTEQQKECRKHYYLYVSNVNTQDKDYNLTLTIATTQPVYDDEILDIDSGGPSSGSGEGGSSSDFGDEEDW